MERYLTLLEAAAELGVHPDSLRRITVRGRVPGAVKWRGKQWLFDRDALFQFASTYRASPGRPPRGLFDAEGVGFAISATGRITDAVEGSKKQ